MNEVIKEVDIDLYDKKIITINASQYDNLARKIVFTCYNQGKSYPIYPNNHYAFIRLKKSDGFGIFNQCEITSTGKISVAFTEQMLSTFGNCYANLVILNNNPVATVDNPLTENMGQLISMDIENDSVLSSMLFRIHVSEAAVENIDIVSSNEFNALNNLMTIATENYYYVMNSCSISEQNAKTSETNAKIAQGLAEDAQDASELARDKSIKAQNASEAAQTKAEAAQTKAETAQGLAESAQSKAEIAQSKAENAQNASETAQSLAESAQSKAEEARDLSINAKDAATIKALEAESSAKNSYDYYILSRSYATGDTIDVNGTAIRTNEDIDNAQYYYDQAKRISLGLNGALLPMGTITFEQLSTMTKESGYMYNISNEFVSTSEFKDGGNHTYAAGTNVYYTADGFWDCFAGSSITTDNIASVSEVLSYLEIE